jgi:hypothetical protein
MYRHGLFTKEALAERRMIRNVLRECSSSGIKLSRGGHLKLGDDLMNAWIRGQFFGSRRFGYVSDFRSTVHGRAK